MSNYLGDDIGTIERAIVNHVEYTLASTRFDFDDNKAYMATSHSVRDRLVERFNDSEVLIEECKSKRVHYLSLEFLIGRSLQNSLINLRIEEKYKEALMDLGFELESIYEEEKDAALGNGGLGRLASCYLDSMASMNIPAWGYGIRYNYGIFKQEINKEGYQIEHPEYWLTFGSPWEIEREDIQFEIKFYGRVLKDRNSDGKEIISIVDTHNVIAVAYDTPVNGYNTPHTINLRLWKAIPSSTFNLSSFNEGDYISALNNRENAISISSILYPNDSTYNGKELRLKQQYFFVSATIQDIIQMFKLKNLSWKEFKDYHTFQLNDTHPAVAIPELIRILMDCEGLSFEESLYITQSCMNYTNHTVLPEALEKWELGMFEKLLPRLSQIIFEINDHLMKQCERMFPGDGHLRSCVSIFEEDSSKRIRMANLCCACCSHVNGVAAIHSQILITKVFNHFYRLFPEKFLNVTNGITPRRWLALCNPSLTCLIADYINGDSFITDLPLIAGIRHFVQDAEFQRRWFESKQLNKKRLADYVSSELGIELPLDAVFITQVKRIHEYKRQLLNILYCIYKYQSMLRMPSEELDALVPVVKIFAGKAAPAYAMAKNIIHLIVESSKIINDDSRLNNKFKVVFIPNYNVSLAEIIIPATNVSEHISTVGTEASGTSNMKFSLNGALLCGTMDGSSIEIADEVGRENVFIFGPTFEEQEMINASHPSIPVPSELQEVFDFLLGGRIVSPHQASSIIQPLLHGDTYKLTQDFPDYLSIQRDIEKAWKDQEMWTMKSIMTVAGMGCFSSDNAIHKYCENIWNTKPLVFEQRFKRDRSRSFPKLNLKPEVYEAYH